MYPRQRIVRAFVAVALFANLSAFASSPEDAARALLDRVLPGHGGQFQFESIAPEDARDVFEIESVDGRIALRGSTSVAMASALNWYLKHFCNASLSLSGNQLGLPNPLPQPPQKVRLVTPFRHRYCFNYCCFSYSMAWWDWPQWERIIDWMALHGINMPLAVTGQEAIWQTVYRQMGLDDSALNQFFVGAAYLPFGWMGCMDGWGGPLTQSWIDSHLELQKKILARERELGMTPVLQGFTGHVPEALKNQYPSARFQQLPSWCGFPGTHFIDPQDPLFRTIGKAFIDEQTRQFGTDHYYASDTFIEMSPPSNDPAFLDAMAKAVHGAMTDADPEAVWVMQGWLFVNNPNFWQPPQARALLSAVPKDRMLVLDLYCESNPAWEKTESFYGNPWAWCIIQDFGNQVSLHGGLPQITQNLHAAVSSPQRGRLNGAGFIMEGLGSNPVVYDLMSDLLWRPEALDLKAWIEEYAARRYGRVEAKAAEAWRQLLATAYRVPGQTGSVICARPALSGNNAWLATERRYDPLELARAWESLLACADTLGNLDTYRYDLVHVTRQVLADLAGPMRFDLRAAYEAKDRARLSATSGRYLDLMRDVDTLLATREEFLLGRWLADAVRWAGNDEERRLLEWNARNQITLWGPRDSVLHDYASKQWAGLIRGFYLPRWEQFAQRLDAALAEGKPFDAGAYERDIQQWEEAWTHDTESYPEQPEGDAIAESRRLWDKYRRQVMEPEALSLTTGKPATCSASLPPYPPEAANDGRRYNTDRYWATDVQSDPDPWWQVDLGEATNVGRVVVVFYFGDTRSYEFTVEASTDGAAWSTVADYRGQPQPATADGITCRFEPRPARYLRVTLTANSANTGRHLVEVMAYPE